MNTIVPQNKLCRATKRMLVVQLRAEQLTMYDAQFLEQLPLNSYKVTYWDMWIYWTAY
jgi:hypothetical protein